MRFIPKKVEGKTPKQVALTHRNNLFAIKEAKKVFDERLIAGEAESDEFPKRWTSDIDERISAVIEFIHEEGMREIDALLDKMVEKGIV
jgi:hypothetical protein